MQYLVPSAAGQAHHLQQDKAPQGGQSDSCPSSPVYTCLTSTVQQLARLHSRTATEQLLLLVYVELCLLPNDLLRPVGLATAAVGIQETVPSR